jgi:hypothetical protein
VSDFNDAGPQRSFDVIPDGTIVAVELTVRPGGAGENGTLRRSKDGRSDPLDCEFTVTEGEHLKRKFWALFTLAGSTSGHETAADISRRTLRAILESARGIRPDDQSEAAKKARNAEYEDFDGLRFIVKVGVEPARDGYKAKSTLAEVITPDKSSWHAEGTEAAIGLRRVRSGRDREAGVGVMSGINITRALDLMRRPGARLLELHERGRVNYYITAFGRVEPDVAAEIKAHPQVAAGEDGLWPGLSQTWRIRP